MVPARPAGTPAARRSSEARTPGFPSRRRAAPGSGPAGGDGPQVRCAREGPLGPGRRAGLREWLLGPGPAPPPRGCPGRPLPPSLRPRTRPPRAPRPASPPAPSASPCPPRRSSSSRTLEPPASFPAKSLHLPVTSKGVTPAPPRPLPLTLLPPGSASLRCTASSRPARLPPPSPPPRRPAPLSIHPAIVSPPPLPRPPRRCHVAV